MRQLVVLVSFITVVLLGCGLLGATPSAAQEATPVRAPVAPGATVSVNGANIYYEVYGRGDPVVLVHGALQSGLAFANQIPAFVDAGYQVIVIDSRGQGRSSHGPDPITFELLASDVLGVMDHIGIAQADLVGWSNGAIVGLELAINHPERLHQVVSYGGQFTPGMVVAATPDPEFDAFIGTFFDTIAGDYQRLSPEPEAWDDRLAEFSALFPDYREEQLHRISVPVLILDGAEEEVVPRESARTNGRADSRGNPGDHAGCQPLRPAPAACEVQPDRARLPGRDNPGQSDAGECHAYQLATPLGHVRTQGSRSARMTSRRFARATACVRDDA